MAAKNPVGWVVAKPQDWFVGRVADKEQGWFVGWMAEMELVWFVGLVAAMHNWFAGLAAAVQNWIVGQVAALHHNWFVGWVAGMYQLGCWFAAQNPSWKLAAKDPIVGQVATMEQLVIAHCQLGLVAGQELWHLVSAQDQLLPWYPCFRKTTKQKKVGYSWTRVMGEKICLCV